MKPKGPAQQSLRLPNTHGGKRRGAGRPKRGPRASQPHKTRPFLAARTPVHVTIRVARDVLSLRTHRMYTQLRWASLTAARHSPDFRIVHVSIQRDHVHLVVEARDRMRLARGMQSFQISAARLINRAHRNRRGAVFPDRYHARQLHTPSEVRNAIAYVLLNWRHHRTDAGRLDPFSTAYAFPHWRELARSPVLFKRPPTPEPLVHYLPRTWLLRNAFHRARHPSIYDLPG